MGKIISIILVFLFSVGCENSNIFSYSPSLDLYMKDGKDSNGNYIVNYNGYNYTAVWYKTDPNVWVSWSSTDSFYVSYQGRLIGTPIIDNSTYSGSDGESKQLIYINASSIGEVYTIKGCLDYIECEYLTFKVY